LQDVADTLPPPPQQQQEHTSGQADSVMLDEVKQQLEAQVQQEQQTQQL
jgi:hypothetical protein